MNQSVSQLRTFQARIGLGSDKNHTHKYHFNILQLFTICIFVFVFLISLWNKGRKISKLIPQTAVTVKFNRNEPV